MTIPEQPGTPALTRKQMREIRNTGATPVITAEAPSETPVHEPEPVAPAPESAAPAAPLPRAAEPVALPEAPVPDASVDLGVSPLTRRQARQQERIRTASVPVITPEIAAAHTAAFAPAAAQASVPDTGLQELFGSTQAEQPPAEPAVVGEAAVVDAQEPEEPDAALELFAQPDDQQDEAESARAVVSPLLGAGLLEAEVAPVELPPSFDQLLARSSSGAGSTPNALILSQSSGASSIVAPVTATGEVLITGTLNLPEGLGSSGHAPGLTDGKEADSVLIDGEIPAHSSPTPIAASAAISTVKNSGEIIKPPAPEKGSKLMMSLAITAGVLALALVGVLILAFVTGVF